MSVRIPRGSAWLASGRGSDPEFRPTPIRFNDDDGIEIAEPAAHSSWWEGLITVQNVERRAYRSKECCARHPAIELRYHGVGDGGRTSCWPKGRDKFMISLRS